MMYYRISKNEKNLFFGKKNHPGVGSDLKQSGEQQFIALIEMVTLSAVIYSIIQELDRMLI